MTTQTKAVSLVGLLTGLISVLERENELLDKPNVEKLTKLVEEKQTLFFEYDQQIALLDGDVSFATSLTAEAKEELKNLSARFDEAAHENELKLQAALKTSDMIVAHITKAASKATGASIAAYGVDGTGHMSGRRAAPIAINRTL